jgi:GxxExxY protein
LADFISRKPRKIGAQNERIAKIAKKKQITGNDISYKIIGAAIEVKAVEAVAPVHFAQLLTYLKLSAIKPGWLINFNSKTLKGNIHGVVNNL